jgi:hypothetical protein
MIGTIRDRLGTMGLVMGVALASLSAAQQQVRLENVRYDIDGKLQKSVISGRPAADDGDRARGGPGGRIRARIVARKRAELKDTLTELAALAESYAHAGPDRLKDAAGSGTLSRGEGREAGTVQIRGRDVVVTGDEMTAWIDPVGRALRRVSISTTFDSQPLTIDVDYRTLDTGVTYPARSTLVYPARSLEVVVDTFEYHTTAGR